MKKLVAVRLGVCCLAAFSLVACSAAGGMNPSGGAAYAYPPRGFAHEASDSHVDFYYNCLMQPSGDLRVEGVAFNPRESQPIGNLEFELDGVGAHGSTVSEGTTQVKNYKILTGQSAPFQIDLHPVGSESRFDLYYVYQFGEGDHNDILSRAAWRVAQPLTQWPYRSYVRNACAPNEHLAR